MKKAVLLILLVSFSASRLLSQQAYQSVVEGRAAYYQGEQSLYYPGNGQVYAVRIDSTENIGNGKKLFQYRQLNNIELYCLGPSWIGSEIIIQNDGLNLFIAENIDNYYEVTDTFQLQTFSSIGTASLFHRFQDSSYLEATCITLSYEQVLGSFDSVKTFSLQLKNPDGSNANSSWNNKEIEVSKGKGLVKFFNLLYTSPANASEEITLIGLTNPFEGYHPSTASEVFDFDVGDHFETSDTEPYWWGTWHDVFQKKDILNKTVSPNEDTFTYKIFNYQVTLSWSNFEFQGATQFQDTTITSYILSDYFPIDSLPFSVQHNTMNNWWSEFFFDFGYNQIYRQAFCGQDLVRIPSYYVAIDSPSGCLNNGLCFGACWVYEFSPGLGIVSKYSADYPNDYGFSLQYYKKDNDSCGTPINFSQILGVENFSASQMIQVFPNPAKDQLWIQSTNQIESVELFDELGDVRKSFSRDEIQGMLLRMDIKGFDPGVYLLRILAGNKVAVKKIVIQ